MDSQQTDGGLNEQLSLSARPKTLDGLIGQDRIVKAIRGHFISKRYPKAWMFSGPMGTGKTTTARILALAYQCAHQEAGLFGRPCKLCRRNKSSFPIYEINAADVTGIDPLRQRLTGADYGVMGTGRYRVYVMDEVHQLSNSAQNLMLKFLEDTPRTTVFILVTTAPHKVLDTLRSRCLSYEFTTLSIEGTEKLVEIYLKKIESTLPADRLVEALVEANIAWPRLIAHAVEKYAAGASPEDAAKVDAASLIDTREMTQAVVKGDWATVAKFLLKASPQNARAIRYSLIAFLRTVLLESPEPGSRTEAVAKALSLLCQMQNAEDLVISGALSAELFRLTQIFSKYRL